MTADAKNAVQKAKKYTTCDTLQLIASETSKISLSKILSYFVQHVIALVTIMTFEF
jgi:hypothetical protein